MTTYFKVKYDNLAGGSFAGEGVAFTEVTWTGGGRGQIIQDFNDGTIGKLHVALIAGALPQDGETMTQGAVSADPNGDAKTLLYPAYFRLDVDITAISDDKEIDWDTVGGAPVADGNGIIPTHSFYFDGQTVDLTVNQILTFSGGQTAELVNIIDQTGADGELEVRFISSLDAGLPVDGDTFTDEGTGDGTLQGEVHPRSYTPLNLHRLCGDLNDDDQYFGDDDMSMLDPTPSAKDTDQIVRLIGGAYITDTVALHMYGGSIAQNPAGAAAGGDTKFSGLDVQVTSPNADSRPVLIQYDITTGLPALITDKWSNAWNPDSIAGNVRVLVKTRENGVDIDGRRVLGKLLEFGDSFFEGSTTLGDATTSLALFASTDGNNQTAVGTVAGAPYNTIVLTDGFQTIDYNNGNGATEFGLKLDYGSATSLQSYERTKYIQRRATAETLFGLNGQLVTGMNRNLPYDTEANGPFLENALIAWGTVVAYDNEATGPFVQGESVIFSGGAVGRILFLDDDGLTGTLIVEITSGSAIADDETITGSDSGATADVNDAAISIEARSGTGWLIALDDDGTTGNLYYQKMAGLDPVDDQPIYGLNAGTLASCLVNGTPSTRTINNQFIGTYTGTNFQTNYGIGIDATDAILGDLNRNLGNVQQGVPNNQTGQVGNLRAGDRVTVYPWDGATLDVNGDAVPDMGQITIDGALTGAAVTSVVVDAIPDHTPQSGGLRLQTTAGGKIIYVPYTSHDGSTTFTCPAFDFSGVNNIDDNADGMIAYLDTLEDTGTDGSPGSESYTAIYVSASTQLTVTVRRGDDSPIVPFKANPSFGSGGFSVDAGRISDA